MDVMDISGEHQSELEHDIHKTRISKEGRPIERKAGGEYMSRLDPLEHLGGCAELTAGMQGEVDKANSNRGPNYCGSCYGASPPENG